MDFGLPKAKAPAPWRIADRGSLEIQAYDDVYFPGLASEWAKWADRRPFVGALAMVVPDRVVGGRSSWIAAGTPPICLGLAASRSSRGPTLFAMISAACAQLGKRALVCTGWTDSRRGPRPRARQSGGRGELRGIFCRPAGRSCTTADSSLAGRGPAGRGSPVDPLDVARIRALAAQLKQLGVDAARPALDHDPEKSLIADLRRILGPQFVARAREMAPQITEPVTSAATAADHVKRFRRLDRVV